MNHLYNTFPMDTIGSKAYDERKKQFARNPDSLFSMALYDFENLAQHNDSSFAKSQAQHPDAAAAFHPVDEYKDMSLREILDISDDFLLDEDKELPFPSLLDQGTTPSTNLLNRSPAFAPTSPGRPQEIRSFEALSVASAISDELMYGFETDSKKRRRQVSEDESSDDGSPSKRFRPYQAGQWAEKFEELCDYREKTGHCLVPHTFSENLPLARWVKRQRYQYKLMKEGKPSTMTEERVKALENIGFVWDSQGAAWGERLSELKEFRKIYMHCNVPSNYSENPQLATWVKCQRRQYKLHLEGKPSNMTPQRIGELESLGFEWELRSYKKTRC